MTFTLWVLISTLVAYLKVTVYFKVYSGISSSLILFSAVVWSHRAFILLSISAVPCVTAQILATQMWWLLPINTRLTLGQGHLAKSRPVSSQPWSLCWGIIGSLYPAERRRAGYHRIIEPFRLEKTPKILKSNLWLNTFTWTNAMSSHSSTFPGMVNLSPLWE